MHTAVSRDYGLPVVVGVDGSRHHLAAVDVAVAEALRRRAPLVILHVWPGHYTGALRPRGPVPQESDGRRLLEIAALRARHQAPQLEVDTELVRGSPASVLLRRSSAARLMIIGHRDDGVARSSWGSTASYLAHHSSCPLLVHRGTALDRGPVVLAASTHPDSAATVGCAYEEASLSGATLVAVHVWTPPNSAHAESPRASAALRREADRQLAESLADWSQAYPDVEVERVVLRDLDVAYTLDRASHRGRLLVAGSGHDGRFAELLYGSLGAPVMRQSVCPVLLVPASWRAVPPPVAPSSPAVVNRPVRTPQKAPPPVRR